MTQMPLQRPMCPAPNKNKEMKSRFRSLVSPIIFAYAVFGTSGLLQAQQASVQVYVSYAENERPPIYFPDPWLGSARTIFLGYPGTFWDTGGILIYNTGSANVVLSRGVRIDGFANGAVFQLWDALIPASGVTIPPGYRLILAQTGAQVAGGGFSNQPCIAGVTPGATCYSNFDPSDTPVVSPPSLAKPVVHLTLNGIAQNLTDSAQVLNTNGMDYGDDLVINEGVQWRLIGTTGPSWPAGTGVPPPPAKPFDVTTYHYDAQRTGFNNQETVLTPSAVGSSAFMKLNTVAFTGHVDAQPLVISAKTWGCVGLRIRIPA
jgi:hypothetical protein